MGIMGIGVLWRLAPLSEWLKPGEPVKCCCMVAVSQNKTKQHQNLSEKCCGPLRQHLENSDRA